MLELVVLDTVAPPPLALIAALDTLVMCPDALTVMIGIIVALP